MIKIEDMKANNARRDASFNAMFAEVLDRLLEAENELVRAVYARTGVEAKRERRNRLRKDLIEAFQNTVQSSSNMQIKYMELASLMPPPPMVIRND